MSEYSKSEALNKVSFASTKKVFFLFLHKTIHCRYSFEAPCKGISNEKPTTNFLLEK